MFGFFEANFVTYLAGRLIAAKDNKMFKIEGMLK
jgi:hypothetical protein